MMSNLFMTFIALMIMLGGTRLWTMFKLARRVPLEKRAEVFARFTNERGRTPESWEAELGPGSAQLIRIQKLVTQLGIATTAGFAVVLVASSVFK